MIRVSKACIKYFLKKSEKLGYLKYKYKYNYNYNYYNYNYNYSHNHNYRPNQPTPP